METLSKFANNSNLMNKYHVDWNFAKSENQGKRRAFLFQLINSYQAYVSSDEGKKTEAKSKVKHDPNEIASAIVAHCLVEDPSTNRNSNAVRFKWHPSKIEHFTYDGTRNAYDTKLNHFFWNIHNLPDFDEDKIKYIGGQDE